MRIVINTIHSRLTKTLTEHFLQGNAKPQLTTWWSSAFRKVNDLATNMYLHGKLLFKTITTITSLSILLLVILLSYSDTHTSIRSSKVGGTFRWKNKYFLKNLWIRFHEILYHTSIRSSIVEGIFGWIGSK